MGKIEQTVWQTSGSLSVARSLHSWFSDVVVDSNVLADKLAVAHRFQNIYSLRHLPLNLNSINQLIFVMMKCGVLFEVRTEFLNNI
jgi:hypothetical protein